MTRKILLALLWIFIIWLAWNQAHKISVPFDTKRPGENLKLLLHKKRPKLLNPYAERLLDDGLATWKLKGPIRLALPPMYAGSPYSNAGFLSSFINHGEVMLYNEPFPYPKISIAEKVGDSGAITYSFDNRSTNAALYVANGADVWPLGFTAWYDMVMVDRTVDVPTPRLVDGGGNRIEPTAARTVHPLNQVTIYGDTTRAEMGHWSPLVWTFPTEGRLLDPSPGYAVESVADGAEVSYLPPLPSRYEHPVAMFLLAPLIEPTQSDAPHWWSFDARFRRAVLERKPSTERRALVKQLASAYPTHPLLTHYRIIADFGDPSFDETWLKAQSRQCEMPSWYLVAWTKLPWSTVRHLPCLKELPAGKLDCRGEYIAESVVFAFRALHDEQLKELANRVVDRSYLRHEFRGFNYPLSNFAWLWLGAHP
jgi:hypothetical protein